MRVDLPHKPTVLHNVGTKQRVFTLPHPMRPTIAQRSVLIPSTPPHQLTRSGHGIVLTNFKKPHPVLDGIVRHELGTVGQMVRMVPSTNQYMVIDVFSLNRFVYTEKDLQPLWTEVHIVVAQIQIVPSAELLFAPVHAKVPESGRYAHPWVYVEAGEVPALPGDVGRLQQPVLNYGEVVQLFRRVLKQRNQRLLRQSLSPACQHHNIDLHCFTPLNNRMTRSLLSSTSRRRMV